MVRFTHVTLFGLVLGVPAAVRADDSVSYQVETGVASSYVTRGISQYNGRSSPSNQNTAALRLDQLAGGAVTFGVFNAVAMDDYDSQPGTAVELDLSVAYSYRRGAATITAGYSANLFPAHMEGTPLDGAHEISTLVSYETPYVVPSAGAYFEVARQQGVYLTAGVTRDLHRDAWTFSPALSVGGATYRKYGGGDKAAAPHLNDVTSSLSARRDFDGGIYAVARLSYAFCGTPAELLPMDGGMGFDGRSTLVGAIAVGVSR